MFAKYYDLQEVNSHKLISQLVDANEDLQNTISLEDGSRGKYIQSTIEIDDSCKVILKEFDDGLREELYWTNLTSFEIEEQIAVL